MSGKPKRAWSSDRFPGSASPPGRKAVEPEKEHGSPGHEPRRGAEDVEILVDDFLKELDALTTEIRPGPTARSERQPKVVAAPIIARDAAPAEAAAAEENIPRQEEQGRRFDIDAELARTLDELEMQEKSNVVALPAAATRAAAPPESTTREVPQAQEARAAEKIPGGAQQPQRVLFSTAGLSKPARRFWKPVIRAAALVFLAGAAFAVYRLLPVAPDAKAPAPPQSRPSAAGPQATPAPVSAPGRAAENIESNRVLESVAPRAATPAAKPAKAPEARPAVPDRASARPGEKPISGESAASRPPESQAGSAEPASANRAPMAAPEPPPVAETKVAAAEKEPQPSAGVTAPETQAPPTAKPPPQTAPAPLPAAQEAARPGTETARPEVAPGNVPPAATPGSGSGEPAAAQPISAPPAAYYTPPEAVSKVMPEYPVLARRANTTGTVEVSVEVDEQGKVVKAAAVSGPYLLRTAAEDALRRWRFKPAVRNGINVRSVVRISVVFRD